MMIHDAAPLIAQNNAASKCAYELLDPPPCTAGQDYIVAMVCKRGMGRGLRRPGQRLTGVLRAMRFDAATRSAFRDGSSFDRRAVRPTTIGLPTSEEGRFNSVARPCRMNGSANWPKFKF